MGTQKPSKDERRRQQRNQYLEKVIGLPEASLLTEEAPEKKQKTEAEKAKEIKDQKQILSREAEKLAALSSDVSNSRDVSRDCNRLLDKARELIGKDSLNVNEVLSNLDRIKQRLIRAYDSRVASSRWLGTLLSFNIGIFVALAVVIGVFRLVPGQDNLQNTAWVCLACGLWGGIGSMIDAFVAMYTHFSTQDFDEHYLTWYFVHPALGIALGAVVYLIIQAGLLATGGVSLQEAGAANTTVIAVQNTVTDNISGIYSNVVEKGGIGVTALPIALAFLAGFRQRAALGFITRIVTAIFQKSSDEDTEQ